MRATRWDERFFASTRGKVITLLRYGHRTVGDLATALGITDNAVRAHLAALERDGLVTQSGVRRGGGKPAFAYALTPAAERLFPKAYGLLVHHFLDALATRLSPAAVDDLLRDVGHRLAAGYMAPAGALGERVRYAVAALGELGGLADVEEQDGGFVIRGHSCPLAAAVQGHPEACLVAEAFLADVIGAPVRQVCDQGAPLCRFDIPASQGAPPPRPGPG